MRQNLELRRLTPARSQSPRIHPCNCALRALEFDRIVESSPASPLTPLGASALAELRAVTDRRAVAQRWPRRTETVGVPRRARAFPLRAPGDLDDDLAALGVEGRPLEPLRPAGARRLSRVDRADARGDPSRRAARFRSGLRAIAAESRRSRTRSPRRARKIEPSGEVVDNASPALATIRDRLRKQRTRLRVDARVVPARPGHGEVPAGAGRHRSQRPLRADGRAEHRARSLASSTARRPAARACSSSRSSTVEINNEIVELEEQEAEEVRRILLALTDAFRARAGELAAHDRRRHRAGRDAGQGALLASRCDGVEPGCRARRRLELRRRGIRCSSASLSAECRCPIDVSLAVPPTRVLLITGPNTGGKTVALKTAGLLALMAQAGLHVPADDGSRAAGLQSIFADIGDEQSISASLSTFSAHITNIVVDGSRARRAGAGAARRGRAPAPIPVEGGALGDGHRRSLPPARRARHRDDALRRAEDVRVDDRGRGQRRVRLRSGDVRADLPADLRLARPQPRDRDRRAARHAAAVVAAARGTSARREAQLAAHLARVDRDLRALEHEHRLAAREREASRPTKRGMLPARGGARPNAKSVPPDG